MAVKTGVASQALGFVEEKLRRVFNIAGPIDASLEPTVKPVILVDDLRDPGHAYFQGRSWVYSGVDTGIVGTKARCVRFNTDVTIEGFWFGSAALGAGSFLQLYYVTPDEMATNPPMAGINTLFGTWRDRKVLAPDQPPILANAAFVAITGLLGAQANVMWQACEGCTPSPVLQPLKMFVPSGGGLCFTAVNVGAVATGLYGRVFPQ